MTGALANRKTLLAVAAFVVLVAVYPFAVPGNYPLGVGITAGAMAAGTVGFVLLFGYAHQLALGQAGFCMVGGYANAILCVRYQWDPFVALVAGAARPGYRHCAQFISELGERGAPHGALVSFAGFLPIGVLAVAFCALAAGPLSGARARLGLLLLSGVGWAYVAAAPTLVFVVLLASLIPALRAARLHPMDALREG